MAKCTKVVLWNLLPPGRRTRQDSVSVGGFAGVSSGLVTTSCWDTTTIGQTQGLGTNLGF